MICKRLSSTNHNLLSVSPTKSSNTLKQFLGYCRRIVWVCLTILRLALKGLTWSILENSVSNVIRPPENILKHRKVTCKNIIRKLFWYLGTGDAGVMLIKNQFSFCSIMRKCQRKPGSSFVP